MAELRTAQVTTNQHLGELAEVVADLAEQVGTLSNRMEATDARIERIWQYLQSQGGSNNN